MNGKNISSNDTISRRAAIDKFTSMPTIDGLGLQPLITVYDVVDTLAKIPSAQPEELSLQKFTKYQIEWLTSHCDIELEPVLEGWIVRFLRDTAECYEAERCEDE